MKQTRIYPLAEAERPQDNAFLISANGCPASARSRELSARSASRASVALLHDLGDLLEEESGVAVHGVNTWSARLRKALSCGRSASASG